MPIEENVKARERAKELIQLIGQESPHYWKVLSDLALLKIAKPLEQRPRSSKDAPMNGIQAKAFEEEEMPCGKYKHSGASVLDVPTEYLAKMAEGAFYEDFQQKLKRYVKSDRFKERQGRE